MKVNIPISISIVALLISITLIIISFILQYWLIIINSQLPNSSNNTITYGMWSGCLNSNQCYLWYDNGETQLAYTLTNYFKAFQGLQCCMLGLIAISVVSLLINLKWCSNLFIIFLIDSLLVFIGASCGIASIVIFGVKIYNPSTQNLGGCFWISVAAICCQLIGLALIVIFALSIILRQNGCFTSSNNDDTSSESGFGKSSYPVENLPEMSTPKMTHSGINEVKKNKHVKANNEIESKKKSQLPNSPRFVKKKSGKDKKKSKKLSNNFESDNKQILNKKHKRRHRLKAKAHSHNHKYTHNHHLPSEFSSEKFKPGYSSEPDVIEYSLDRSWLNQNSFNQSLPENLDSISQSENRQNINEEGITNTFTSRHFVKLPKLVYYDGQDHYSRANNDQNVH